MNEILWRTRWSKDQIRAMLIEQFESFWLRDTGIEREKLKEIERSKQLQHAVIISGLRRVGKSTLLAQLAHKLGKEQFYYLNFEDDRFLGFGAEDFNDLYQLLIEEFSERKIFIIDEIQNIPGWEHFVRRFMEMGFKFYISGSNASLLSRELGTHLTGRYINIDLFPFSFSEFILYRKEELPNFERMTTIDRGRIHRVFNDYLQLGGIPDAIKYPELPLLRSLYDDVLFRDIAARYHIDAVTALKELSFFLISNPAGYISFNKLKEQLRLGSVNTVTSYIEYLENSWLIFTLNLYAFSVKRQQIAAKKVYCIDTGMINTVGFRFSPNTGKLLENLVFLALRQHTREIYYYVTRSGYEVDFYIPEDRKLIQVSKQLNDPSTREREIRAIEEAAGEVHADQVILLTDEANVENNGKNHIRFISIPEWLINESLGKNDP